MIRLLLKSYDGHISDSVISFIIYVNQALLPLRQLEKIKQRLLRFANLINLHLFEFL